MKHYIEGNIYYICGSKGEILFKLTLTDIPSDQVIIETKKEVYAGPISLLNLSKI